MSGKFQKNTKTKKKNKLPLILGMVVVLLVVILAALLLLMPAEETSVEIPATETPVVQDKTVTIRETAPVSLSLGNDLEILNVGSYTGAYVEDGSDEVLSGILMLKVINNGEKTVEYAKIAMDVNGEAAEFTLSTLKPGATIVLLEKNRMAYNKDARYGSVVCENLALFQEEPDLHGDKFSVQILDGALNVTNISQENIDGRIAIYYKNKASGIYYGGITYRVILENGLKAGELRQVMADHFSDTGTEILFITVAQ